MLTKTELNKRYAEGRTLERAAPPDLPSRSNHAGSTRVDLVDLLSGTWTSQAQGWNLIALPFGAPDKFRLLVNQYSETLNFNRFVDRNVPNRGIQADADGHTDQLIDAIAYEQIVHQIDAEDFPASPLKARNQAGIHHEPGFFLQLLNHAITGHTEEEGNPNGPEVALTIARQASIPHGDSVLAMGTVTVSPGAPIIDPENALPERISQDMASNPYLAPYKHFEDHHFFGKVPKTAAGFPGFFPSDANAILRFSNPGKKVKETTTLSFDTKYRNAQLTDVPIKNIPFVTREANVTEMHSTFWIMELDKDNAADPTEFIMQYTQTVYLEFFGSDEPGKPIRWPHVSINTLRKA